MHSFHLSAPNAQLLRQLHISARLLTHAGYGLTKTRWVNTLDSVHDPSRKECDVPQGDGELMQIPEDSATQKADSLVDTDFVVLDVEYADTSDGRTHVQKMLVRHPDQTLGLYWTPSAWCKRVLEDWFRRYPGRELFVTLTREPLATGGFKWMLVQRKHSPNGEVSNEVVSEMAAQVPF